MRKILKLISILLIWGVPILVVYYNHIELDSGGYNVNMVGLTIIAILVMVAIRRFNKKVLVWEIQDKKVVVREFYNGLKAILALGGIVWVLQLVDNNMIILTETFTIIFITVTFGILIKWGLLLFPKKA